MGKGKIWLAAGFCWLLIWTWSCQQQTQSPESASANANAAASSGAATGPAGTSHSNAAQTTQAPDVSKGSIAVTSTPPGAAVILIATEGDLAGKPESRGSTPVTTEVEPGKYTVDIEKDGYKYFQKEVAVAGGKVVKVDAKLKKETK